MALCLRQSSGVEQPGDVPFDVEHFISQVIPRLKLAGYGVIVLASHDLAAYLTDDRRNDTVWSNVARIKIAAAEHEIEVIPEVFPIGSSDSLLENDSSLAEAVPVVDCQFKVTTSPMGELIAVPANTNSLIQNGDFMRLLEGWEAGRSDGVSIDAIPSPEDASGQAVRFEFDGQQVQSDAEQGQSFSIKPRHQYQVSYWLRDDGLSPAADECFYLQVAGRGPDHGWMNLENVSHQLKATANGGSSISSSIPTLAPNRNFGSASSV